MSFQKFLLLWCFSNIADIECLLEELLERIIFAFSTPNEYRKLNLCFLFAIGCRVGRKYEKSTLGLRLSGFVSKRLFI